MTWRLDATALLAGFAEGTLSPAAVMDTCLQRIASLGPQLGAFVSLSPDAREAAAASTERWRRGTPLGPLDGIPVAVKDNLVASGMPATFGSRIFGHAASSHDELPVARLRGAGAIIIGKTNTPEFAIEGYTANARFGVTRNPFAPALTPGGSSGGSVAAVAAGLVPVALGTDGGGSIRRPAAYTGLIGLKPSLGRVPRAGGLPQILLDFEVVGPLVRSARDLRLLMDVLSGPDRIDPASRRVPAEQRPATQPLRVLYVPRFGNAPCDPAILHACANAAQRLQTLGHTVDQGELPLDLSAINAKWTMMVQVGVARMLLAMPGAVESLPQKYQDLATAGEAVDAMAFADMLADVDALRRDASLVFGTWDLIVTPCCAAMPWPADQTHPPEIDGQPVGLRGHAIYTGWVNAAGLPGVSLPAGMHDGIPIGVQIVADWGQDAVLLDIADSFMSGASPEPDRSPPNGADRQCPCFPP
jgi:aspartyl-tRNA(Asn)/glutamyl-tRNA(Gln) amidotransferase subunit A